ncbi:MAG: hypothetical protein GPJ54_12620 [Candidatus Heimdallarchaeota archaeon]|nr:hypothetical protein [Candidatus Heimdallarchaeota archaeon]
MDITELIENKMYAGFPQEALEILDQNREDIYPPDYYFMRFTIVGLEDKPNVLEEWEKNIGALSNLENLQLKLYSDYFHNVVIKTNYVLNSPPVNADELRIEISSVTKEKVDICGQIIDEYKKFDLRKANIDGYNHFNWSKPIWVNTARVFQKMLQAIYHFLLLQPEQMIQSAKESTSYCIDELENSIFKVAMLNNLAIYYRVINNIDKNRETRLIIKEWLESFILKHGYSPFDVEGMPDMSQLGTYADLGSLAMFEGDLIQAERYYNRYLEYSQSGKANKLLSEFYIISGELDKAYYHLERSKKLHDQNPDNSLEAQYHINRAKILNLEGKNSSSDIEQAIELIEDHLKKNEFITSTPTIETYFRVADIYMANSDLDGAKKYYSIVAEMCKIVHYYDFHRAECLMKLIHIACIEGKDTELLKNELYGVVADFSSHEKMVLYKDLSEAIILKHVSGAQMGRSRSKSLEIFEKISRGKIYDINLHFFAKYNYCELLLDEFQFYGHEEILEILVNDVDNLAEMTKEKGLILYYIEVLILRSKIATLQKDLEASLAYLEEAQEMADKKKLINFQERIKAEKEIYLQNLDSWNFMRKDDKIEKLRLKQYLKFAQQNITK